MAPIQEKRKYVRVQPLQNEPVAIHLMGASLLDVLIASDISMGGIGIIAPNHFDEWDMNETVEILVALPGDLEDFLARGVIRQIGKKSKESGVYGVQFTEIGPKGKQDLQVYVNRMIRQGRELK
ncbi:PilZ domain-containing protein [Leptospira sp. 2 VSF19]|uniref:PilZ domain-containing protein n=1 Tax=Leptospira soteropolitanensis TaxID=2950025 RepID=A0AAW5VRT9_9LEPT|nr:PilZ domain-containing protein [Leptospira soteropolitanensis]MCW7493766.1 PilZ domain-containing protein [Leptospira soteropolitanensis]MCW7501364.1 PilZ domain-containing protein [Leptospira soteropolitanensis]MCW7523450.1 PilZ domain-containing protein [Leptospira soteropolitanensis]MCW7527478.1 PilZ domain-containing protein [Leptospira soteropolitanensis]MCW7531334.1 PilZ domain-containing protein [Leptospira soteropolitanensis]